MKIKRLVVLKYKNIENIDLQFNSSLITLLVGQNGLGKSNLLEILAIIFSNIDLLETEQDFNDWPYEKVGFEFDIYYECKGFDIRIHSMEGMYKVFRKPINSDGNLESITFSKFRRDKRQYYPDFIIGYYSGENKRLKEIIKIHEDLQFKSLKNWNKSSSKVKEQSLRPFFFTENFHSQLLLTTLSLYSDQQEYKIRIDDLLENYLNIEQVNEFDIRFNNPDWQFESIEGINKGADYLISNISNKELVESPFWNIKGKVDKLLTMLYNYQIDNNLEPVVYPRDDEDVEPKFVSEFIEFRNINIKKFINELTEFSQTPIDLFDALESSNILEIFNKITLQIKKKGIENFLSYTSLSEGEQQLLTVLGLVIIFGKFDCLFLFDEPDTHLNPKWQRDYVSLLKRFNSEDENSHIIVATHSPLVVQAAEKADILLFKSKDDGRVDIINNENLKIHNWRIDQVLASEYFGIENTRPIKTDKYLKLKQEIIRQGELSEENIQQLKEIEDELGYLPFGETITEIESLAFLNQLTKRDDLH